MVMKNNEDKSSREEQDAPREKYGVFFWTSNATNSRRFGKIQIGAEWPIQTVEKPFRANVPMDRTGGQPSFAIVASLVASKDGR